MKRASQSISFLLFLLISFFLMSFSSEVVAQSVYITKTGKKYHKESCRYGKTGLATTLADAKKKGLTACLVCKPGTTESKTTEPTLIKSNTSKTIPTQNSSSRQIATSKAKATTYLKAFVDTMY